MHKKGHIAGDVLHRSYNFSYKNHDPQTHGFTAISTAKWWLPKIIWF